MTLSLEQIQEIAQRALAENDANPDLDGRFMFHIIKAADLGVSKIEVYAGQLNGQPVKIYSN